MLNNIYFIYITLHIGVELMYDIRWLILFWVNSVKCEFFTRHENIIWVRLGYTNRVSYCIKTNSIKKLIYTIRWSLNTEMSTLFFSREETLESINA